MRRKRTSWRLLFMKLELIFVSFLVVSSCTPPEQPVVEKFFPLGPRCDVSTSEREPALSNATLDVAAGAPQVFVGVRITSGEEGDRPQLTQMVVTYRLNRRIGAEPGPFTTLLSGPFSEHGVALVTAQLISPELSWALFDALVPSPDSAVIDDFVDLQAEVVFRGEYAKSRQAFTTTSLTYPIRAFRSQPMSCPAGYERYRHADPCAYVGQTSSQLTSPAPPRCCGADSPAGSGC